MNISDKELRELKEYQGNCDICGKPKINFLIIHNHNLFLKNIFQLSLLIVGNGDRYHNKCWQEKYGNTNFGITNIRV